MVPEEGYIMHRRRCSAMARWADTDSSSPGAQRSLRYDGSSSDESMHVYDHGTGLKDAVAKSLQCGSESVTLNAVAKGPVE